MSRGAAAGVVLLTAAALWAQRLPIRTYSTSDGIASTNLNCSVRDSRGFLWFCTSEGLSRYDGYTFANYTFSGTAQTRTGIGRAAVDFLETRNGELWVASPRALCRFAPLPSSGNPLSECYQPAGLPSIGSVARITEAFDGAIWFLHSRGLFRFFRNDHHFEPVDLGFNHWWTNLIQDSDGSLWVGAEGVLAHRLPNGRVDIFTEAEGLPVDSGQAIRISAMLRDRQNRLWIGTWQGLCLMVPHPQPGARAVEHVYTTRDGLPGNVVFDVFQARDGTLWVSGEKGLSEWLPANGAAGGRFRSYTTRRGFDLYGVDGPPLADLAEDSSGDLWMTGPMRLARHGFISYSTADGLASNQIKSVFEDRDGRLVAISADHRPRFLNVFDGQTFHSVVPRVPASIHGFTWGQTQIHFQDHTGAWWVATGNGLCRYPKVRRVEDLAHTLPEKIYTTRDGLPGEDIFRLFEDSRGDVWISVVGPDAVSRWSRATGRIEVFRQGANGRPLGTPIAFAEDHDGDVWMSFYWHDLARYRDGRFEVFSTAEGVPSGPIPSLLVDHAGRLWIVAQGLRRLDNPSAARPAFRFYGIEAGMSSIDIACLVEDQSGRIYAAGPHGIDQLNPATGRIRHYGESAGLPSPGNLAAAYRDRQGNLWFAGTTLAKFVPQPENPEPQSPPIRITRIGTRGAPHPLSELGQSTVDNIRVRSSENAIQIEFASLDFDVAGNIRFQYKLEGSRQDWSAPTKSRIVDYASLSPGSYRFLVRAVNTEGLASENPASVAFVILPPFWQRWWFVTASAAALALLILAWHRYRVRQLLELERVRTRIATDLHDDIGSSLTQIAILSEVARRNNGNHSAAGAEPLERIADLSRALVDSMSDIVWAINPHRDHLTDLEHRMRRFAADVLAPRDIEFDLEVPVRIDDVPLRAEVRRQVFLIFKECIHNIVRHSGCRHVRVGLEYRGHRLLLTLADDGHGFAAPSDGNGNGLDSMRRRAAEIGGKLEILSAPATGTHTRLTVPNS